MATAQQVKMEDGGLIKLDPDALQPDMVMDEDDQFEDTHDLELPKELGSAWLVRIPPQLHEKWATADMDTEMVIGTVRRYKKTGKQQIILNPTLPMYQGIPKVYDVLQTESSVTNTYVFSEKDLPGYKKGHNKNKQDGAGGGARVDKNQRFNNFRRAIPKQTALKALIKTESNCKAEDNAENQALLRERIMAQEHKRPKVEFLNLDPRESEGMSLNAGAMASFDGFVKTAVPKTKPQENKAARIPRNELLDRLFHAFGRYEFWSLSVLREEVRQPEAYLKEVLNEIAELIKSGPAAGNYRLKPEAKRENFMVKGDQAEDSDDDLKDEDGKDESMGED